MKKHVNPEKSSGFVKTQIYTNSSMPKLEDSTLCASDSKAKALFRGRGRPTHSGRVLLNFREGESRTRKLLDHADSMGFGERKLDSRVLDSRQPNIDVVKVANFW